MADSALEAALEGWSRVHALCVLCAGLAACWLGALWPLALEAALAFPMLVARHWRVATPSGRFGVANQVTALRLLAVLLLSLAGARLSAPVAGASVLVIFALDGLDGWLARRNDEASVFGAHFDMETDALLVLVSACLLRAAGRASAFVLLAGALRYLYVLGTWLLPPPARAPTRSRLGRYLFSFYVSSTIACFFLAPELARPLSALATLGLLASFARSSLAAYAGS